MQVGYVKKKNHTGAISGAAFPLEVFAKIKVIFLKIWKKNNCDLQVFPTNGAKALVKAKSQKKNCISMLLAVKNGPYILHLITCKK